MVPRAGYCCAAAVCVKVANYLEDDAQDAWSHWLETFTLDKLKASPASVPSLAVAQLLAQLLPGDVSFVPIGYYYHQFPSQSLKF